MRAANELTGMVTVEQTVMVKVKRNGLTQRQLEMRRTGIGGSEIGAVGGLSKWCSPLEVWRRKVHGEVLEETKAMKRGRLLEPAVADWYAEETGATLRKVGRTLRHPERSMVIATPDRIATLNGAPRVLEIKTTNHAKPDEWGESGTDEVPEAYLTQVAWTMAVTDMPSADLAVLIAGDDFRLYHFERDLELEGNLFELGEKFWVDHVLARVPPPVMGLDNEWLKHRFPRDNGESIPFANLTEDAQALVRAYVAQWQESKATEKHLEDLEAQVRALMGGASELAGPGFRIDWKQNKPGTSVDWKAVAAAVPEVVSKFTVVKPGNRPFRPYILKGGKQ